MAIYERNSRYAKFAKVEEVTDAQGRKMLTVGVARVPAQKELGEHIRRDGQRLDHLASYYLKEQPPTGGFAKSMTHSCLTNSRRSS